MNGMSTIALKPSKTLSDVIPVSLYNYNKYALAACTCVLLFVAYFALPHIGLMRPFFKLGVLYVVGMPIAALIFSGIAIRQITESGEKGRIISYTSLALASLYFITGLAIPFVLIGCYVFYTYVI